MKHLLNTMEKQFMLRWVYYTSEWGTIHSYLHVLFCYQLIDLFGVFEMPYFIVTLIK